MVTFESLGIKTKVNAGVRYATICPKCSELRKPEHKKTPCLTVNDEAANQWFNCQNCSWSGNLKMFDRFEKVYKAARVPKTKQTIYSKEVLDWIESKHLSGEVMMQEGIYERDGGAYKEGKWVLTGHKEVCFPYFHNHTMVNCMFRRIVYNESEGEPKVYFITADKGTERVFWGLNKLNLEEKNDKGRVEVIITEGQTDRITWLQCGFKNVLSIPDGVPALSAKNLEKKLEFVTNNEIKELFKKVHRFYIVMDNDAPGQAFKETLAEHLGKQRCFIIKYPPGYNDSNELYGGDVEKGLDPLGKSGIEELYENAKAYPLRGVIEIWDVEAGIEQIVKNDLQKGYIISDPSLDNIISLRKDLTVIVTGIPGDGKSTWLRWYLVEQCRINPFMHWALHPPEARPKREFGKILEVYAGKKLFEYAPNKMNQAEREAAMRWVSQHFTIVNPDKRVFELFDPKARIKGLKNILWYFKQLKETKGIFGYVIDPWNKLEHERAGGMTETDFISRQLDIVTEFNEINDMCGIVVAHPTKIETVRGGNYREPTLYDISGSANWFNKPNIGITVYRKNFYNTKIKNDDGDDIWEIDENAPSQIIVNKMKEEELGKKGRVKMWLDQRNGNRFTTKQPAVYPNEKKTSAQAQVSDTIDDCPF